MKTKNFFAGKGVGYYLTLPALICAIAALILYSQTGVTQFSVSLSGTVIASLCVAMGLCLASLILDFRPVRYAAYLVCLFSFLSYVHTQVDYIGNVFVGIDGNSFTAGFIATVISFVLAFLLMLVSAILTKNGKKEEKK